MDPGMSGMEHSQSAIAGDHSEAAEIERPLKATLVVFGFGTLLVLLLAILLRRKDRTLAAVTRTTGITSYSIIYTAVFVIDVSIPVALLAVAAKIASNVIGSLITLNMALFSLPMSMRM